MKRTYLVFILCFFGYFITAQTTPFILKAPLKETHQEIYRKMVNSINKNLSIPLTDSTEERWESAFQAMEFINYRSAWTDNKIHTAFNDLNHKSDEFKVAILELAYTSYPDDFADQIRTLFFQTEDPRLFAICAVYIVRASKTIKEKDQLIKKTKEKLSANNDDPVLLQLLYQLNNDGYPMLVPPIADLMKKSFLPGKIVLFSFQRKNRDFPGIAVIRDAEGHFMYEQGNLFYITQFARSIAGLPGYLTNGNTPEGIFRMDGFDTSKSSFIGPTPNVQLTMPFEYKASHFFQDSLIADSLWSIEQYKKLLPSSFRDYYPAFQTFYAGKAGRTEIIAHGTTIDPGYYKNKPYYPLIPTQGCLCAKESWNEDNGRLIQSDQQKLVDMIIKAGGPQGYAVVLNIGEQEQPVTIEEIADFIQQAARE